MRFNGIVLVIYALLVIIGGMIGFVKANSVPSLIMGITFALGLLLSAVGMVKGRMLGYFAGIALTAILAGFFLYRYSITQQMMPAGLMSILSVIVLIALFLGKKSK